MSMTYVSWISLAELNWVKCGTQYKLPAQGYICLEDNLACNLSALIQETFLKGKGEKSSRSTSAEQQIQYSVSVHTVSTQLQYCCALKSILTAVATQHTIMYIL